MENLAEALPEKLVKRGRNYYGEHYQIHALYKVCLILMIIGGINWGLVGLFQFDFVGWLLGGSSSIWSRIVFTVVGVAAVCGIPGLFAEETEE